MKKKVLITVIVLLMATGCTCEYNLNIENNTYEEKITLKANDTEELSNFNQKWTISTDKNVSNIGLDPSSETASNDSVYDYTLSGNNLTFNYRFPYNEYKYSTAVSKCYNNLTVTEYNNTIIISTSSNTICFENYPALDSVTININVDKRVISHNADNVNNGIYTWQLTKTNHDKAINMVLDNQEKSVTTTIPKKDNSSKKNKKKKDYTLFIFSGILLIVLLLGYFIFTKLKNKENDMDV